MTTGDAASAQTVFVVTHVDFIPLKKDERIAELRSIADSTRRESGNLRFDTLLQSSRQNHLTLVETWRDEKALEAHKVASYTAKFRTISTPMSGGLFDQRRYRAIDD